jgi:hypothetical protein
LKIHYCNADDSFSSEIVAPDDSDSVFEVEPATTTPTPIVRKRVKKTVPKKVAPVVEEAETPVAKKVPSRKGKE